MSGFTKNIFVICICIACAALGYYLFVGTDDSELAGNTVVRQELINKTQSFIERSAKLQQINIDQSLFTDSTFTSLRSFSTPVPNQPLGRNDIFGDASSISISSSIVTEE
jgi:hypothetical protein